MDEPDTEDVFTFLNVLRESGETNMFGAGPWIMKEFDVDHTIASRLLGEWMEQFND